MRDMTISLWFWMFVLIKVAGSALAAWSWWWVLCPIIPDIAFIAGKLGWAL